MRIFKKVKKIIAEPRTESKSAKVNVQWLLFYGLLPEEVPARVADKLTPEDRKNLLGR